MALAEDVRVTGTLAASGDTVVVSQPATATVAVNLVVTGTNTTVFEATVDEGTSPTWVAVKAMNVNTGGLVASATATALFRVDMSGYRQFRVRCSSYSSGNVAVTLNASVAPSVPTLDGSGVGGFNALPAVTLTRPANTTAYSAQKEVATGGTSAAAISVSRYTGGSGLITGASLVYSSNPSTTPSFRLLLFNAQVTAAGDNQPLNLSGSDSAKFIGMIDFSKTQAAGALTSNAQMQSGAPDSAIPFTTDTVYALLITTNAWTPIANSETINITLRLDQN